MDNNNVLFLILEPLLASVIIVNELKFTSANLTITNTSDSSYSAAFRRM